jgi:hypothetical protein
MVLILQTKNTLKNKTQPFVAYKKGTLLAKANVDLVWKNGKSFPKHGAQGQAEVALFISDIAYFKVKLVRRNKEHNSILIKETIQQEEIAIVDIYVYTQFLKASTTWCKKYKQIDPNTIILGDIIPHSLQLTGQPDKKINKKTLELNDIRNQNELNKHLKNILLKSYRLHIILSSSHSFF